MYYPPTDIKFPDSFNDKFLKKKLNCNYRRPTEFNKLNKLMHISIVPDKVMFEDYFIPHISEFECNSIHNYVLFLNKCYKYFLFF